jgi:hypothetical protein
MNCQKTESVINDLAREQMIETSLRNAAISHCDECNECARSLEDQRALTLALHGLAQDMESFEAPKRLQDQLAAALRDQAAVPVARSSGYRWKYLAAAVAAMLLVSFAVLAFRLRERPAQKSTAQMPSAPESTQVVGSSSPEVNVERTVFLNPKRSSPRRRFQPGSRTANKIAQAPKAATMPAPATTTNYGTEIATEFLPLGYGNALNLQDGGQIVRVEVPRSTLASFGLPVNMNRVSERVKADVLFGADGSARAIRFVQ